MVDILRMYNSATKLIVGADCVDVSDSDAPIDVYLGSGNVYSDTEVKSSVSIGDNAITRFGANAVTITRGR